jgi:hypothetical protein
LHDGRPLADVPPGRLVEAAGQGHRRVEDEQPGRSRRMRHAYLDLAEALWGVVGEPTDGGRTMAKGAPNRPGARVDATLAMTGPVDSR